MAPSRRLTIRVAVLAVTLAMLAAAACGGGGSSSKSSSSTSKQTSAAGPKCPLGALAKATKPVTIKVWHSMPMANETTLQNLTARFNSSQSDVKVELVNQTSYDDTFTKYKAALGAGERPDVVQIQDVDQQLMIDSKSIIPASACMKADNYSTSDLLPRVLSYFTSRGTTWAVPFSISNPVLYYNKNAFRAAGLDPEKPPATLADVRTDAQKIVASGFSKYGLALKIDPWYLEHWLAMSGQLLVNNGNGRDKRATAVAFDNDQGKQIFQWLSGMAHDGLAESTPQTGVDNLFAIGNKVVAMTFDTSAALGTIVQVLGSGQFKDISLGVATLPGPNGPGGSIVAGSGLYLVDTSHPEREEAAWRFAKFLIEPQQMADWAAGTGYIPITESSTKLPTIQDLWAKNPQFKVAYDQLRLGSETAASAGAMIGDFEGVRRAVVAAEEAIFTKGADPGTALHDAATAANAAIADYERRIGN